MPILEKSRNVYAIKLPLTEQIILKALSEIDIILKYESDLYRRRKRT
ncbi:hypothetical protein HMPREF0493_0146 [Lactobacillus amylolyticus DSM 11664]|uniref:Uncharacterized protein n=1 Tax=Lactobacillus amylolyticus DSM 11664 TaxID=585524 RepID=D4YRL8_9LACO|nr:hypothetical protein HMPREF0493_0146 [Lactobacillus amylolyticus DSM 11664]